IRDQFETSMNEFMANMNSGAGRPGGASGSSGAGGSGGTGGNANGTEPEAVKVEQYIRGLTKSIRGDVSSLQPATINDAVRLAYQLARLMKQPRVRK
nr:hypothetical protein [Tanacetum cinerariifolium]